jgi:hypothetical protein
LSKRRKQVAKKLLKSCPKKVSQNCETNSTNIDEKTTKKRRMGIPRPGGDCVAPGNNNRPLLLKEHICQILPCAYTQHKRESEQDFVA